MAGCIEVEQLKHDPKTEGLNTDVTVTLRSNITKATLTCLTYSVSAMVEQLTNDPKFEV
jgi:hypothetical protein